MKDQYDSHLNYKKKSLGERRLRIMQNEDETRHDSLQNMLTLHLFTKVAQIVKQ